MHEGIPILNYLVPKAFTHEDGRLTGMLFEKVQAECDEKGRRKLVPTGEPDELHRMRRRAGRGRPGERLPLDRARHRPRVRRVGHAGGRPGHASSRPCPNVFFGGDAAFGPKNIIWAVAHGHDAAISIDKLLQRRGRRRAPAAAWSTWCRRRWASTSGATTTTSRNDAALQGAAGRQGRDRAEEHQAGGRARLRRRSSPSKEAQRCLNCDVQTVFADKLCIECDACVDICPMDCITFTANGEEADCARA